MQVPTDAHVMDLVFLDSSDSHGGFYDNNKGLDYHIPGALSSAIATRHPSCAPLC